VGGWVVVARAVSGWGEKVGGGSYSGDGFSGGIGGQWLVLVVVVSDDGGGGQ
jgi:hypothetical protein